MARIVVVAGNDVVDLIRVTVGVDYGNYRNSELMGFGYRVALLARVDDKDCAGQLLHVLDAAEVLFKPFDLKIQLDDFLLRKQVECAVFLHLAELGKPVDPAAHCLEVCQHSAEPAGIDIVHADTFSLFADRVLGLLLRPDEKYRLSFGNDVANEIVGFLELLDGHLEIDDIDAVALSKDVGSHFGVPSASLVSEMHTGSSSCFIETIAIIINPPSVVPPQSTYRVHRCSVKPGRKTLSAHRPPVRLRVFSV